MENKLMSQEKMILTYLKQGWSLTPLQALKKFRCLRLGGRIYDLRKKGYIIDKKTVTIDGKHVAQYTLIPPRNQFVNPKKVKQIK